MDGAPGTGGALVLGANYRALGLVRSLGRRGVAVDVALADEHRLAAASRYCRRSLLWPREQEDSEQVDHLLGLADRTGLAGWTVFPTTDQTAFLLARHKARLRERFIVAAPDWESMRWAHDKRLTYELGERAGIPQPRAWFPGDADEAAGLDCAFPVVVKPTVKAYLNPFTRDKAWRVDDPEALRLRFVEALEFVTPEEVFVQELIPGGPEAQMSFAALTSGGRPVAYLTARRARQHPMDFGHASTFVETVDAPDVATAARCFVEAARCDGLVEVEFKRDSRDSTLKLLDVNCRIWGWHSIGARAGVDFGHLYWRQLHGEPVEERRGTTGVRWVRLTTDLPTAAREVVAGRLSARAYLWSLRGPLEHGVMARDDPLPGLADAPLSTLVAARRSLSWAGFRARSLLRRRARRPLGSVAPVEVGRHESP